MMHGAEAWYYDSPLKQEETRDSRLLNGTTAQWGRADDAASPKRTTQDVLAHSGGAIECSIRLGILGRGMAAGVACCADNSITRVHNSHRDSVIGLSGVLVFLTCK